MLHELNIENYAVVDKLRVRFHDGLNLLTGETGSGKSIVVDALSLLLGARATADVIRPNCAKARVAGIFEAAQTPELRRLLEQTGLELEHGELIVEREVLEGGKSRAYVNGRVVTLAVLRELGAALGDIHGQHEQQSLFSTRTQLEMLDAFAQTSEAAAKVAATYHRWRECEKRLAGLRSDEQEKRRQLDLYRFQLREIGEASLELDEELQLEQERRLLGNLERVQQSAAAAYELLYDSSRSVAGQLKAARGSLEELLRFDAHFAPMIETLESARAGIEDAAFEIRGYLDRLEANPERLEQIEDRLALIHKLKRKYGGSLEQVLAHREQARVRVEELESSDATIESIEKEQRALAEEFERLAEMLSSRRRKAAARLEAQVDRELASLEMQQARFRVAFGPVEAGPRGWSANGVDQVAFLVSANPGQPPRALAQVASGGELSRITLALKTCLVPNRPSRAKPPGRPASRPAHRPPPLTLVFDEIDAGVGGRVAEALGRRLKTLAASHQVLCVTHLSQIAAFADAHYFVEKYEKEGTTFASVVELAEDERVAELARMLSGATITTAAKEHARQILKSNRKAAARG